MPVSFAVSFAYFCLLQIWRKETSSEAVILERKEWEKLLEEKGAVYSNIKEFVVEALNIKSTNGSRVGIYKIISTLCHKILI